MKNLHSQTKTGGILLMPSLGHLNIVLQVDCCLQGGGVFPTCLRELTISTPCRIKIFPL